jgi:magnesium transporter
MEQLQPRLQKAVHEGDFAGVRDQLDHLPPSTLANVIHNAPVADQPLLFRCLSRPVATTTFEYLPLDQQQKLLKSMANEEVAEILNHMADDDRTLLLEELPATATKQLLELLSEQERAIALQLLGYPERSVGRLMTPHYIAVHPRWSVLRVLDYVREHGKDSETLTMVYVIDEHGLLVDDIRIRSFLLAPLTDTVSDLMDNHFIALKASDTQETAVRVFRQADLPALPVTDTAGVLIGIVTSDDVFDVAEREGNGGRHRGRRGTIYFRGEGSVPIHRQKRDRAFIRAAPAACNDDIRCPVPIEIRQADILWPLSCWIRDRRLKRAIPVSKEYVQGPGI